MALRLFRPLLRTPVLRVVARPTPLLRGSLGLVSAPKQIKSFTSSPRRLGSGESDTQLSSALASEHTYELESASPSEIPEFLETFQEMKIWDIQDVSGSEDVVLTRKFGNETLKLTFQISDIDNDFPSSTSTEETLPEEPESNGPAYVTCSLLLTKPNGEHCLAFDLEAGEEGFGLTNVAVLNKKLGEMIGAEGDWQRRSKYMGPQFDHLDIGVQDGFVAYLAERGVDDSLANFILAYCDYKEQKEYVAWLSQVGEFVEL
ncbi:hypothetical protein TREMEDRAFT_73516 [Tremella mesenterica DSM 1558]|uniref:uncharacterized protein n=1 Tax=Tremella mesenterica (strain ATCC 24925 / CBS 8224 / DSM 1558 / NBRC 9311 / NRRL Y-6157 / RJB 2259-6 / UBC 559-6) TaxID=578456 RepID=UPI0003F4A0AC|nr:uncharacterized protein TREMEDRAFT_73516 [Tremella mesenterica DSM 1558]EIW70597.1 hypothetical protein TREMEDRAFT_73516 [Tremella mesenterica DSM 1558]